MKTHFNILTHQNWNQVRQGLPGDSHIINYSKLQSIAFEQAFRGFSIKFVVAGQENYKVNGREHQVRAGEYLLTNPHCHGNGYIDSKSMVEGVCIDIQPGLMAEVLGTLQEPGNLQPGYDTRSMLESGLFFEYRLKAAQTRLGQFLNGFSHLITSGQFDLTTLNQSFYYRLTELYLSDYQHIAKQVFAVPALKPATRNDLFLRAQRGKDFMDAMFTAPIDLPEIAKQALLSEYHFYRIFKAVYQESPHQYILKKRLDFGQELLLTGNYSVTEAAQKTGFADIFSFSKAYRKRFGMPPSAVFLGKLPFNNVS